MKIKCEYCGSMFDDTLEKCPNCGNNNVRRSTSDQPTTIEELKEWYVSKGLPDEEVTRFFIGRDYKGSKAFGIYKNAKGKFIVYKNKADGSRAVRYEGTDEAYAVNELLTAYRKNIFFFHLLMFLSIIECWGFAPNPTGLWSASSANFNCI